MKGRAAVVYKTVSVEELKQALQKRVDFCRSGKFSRSEKYFPGEESFHRILYEIPSAVPTKISDPG